MRVGASAAACLAAWYLLCTGAQAATLDGVRARDYVQCGVDKDLPGFSHQDAKGNWKGLDVDICRAVAAAVLKDAAKVRLTPLSGAERFPALAAGDVDILLSATTWTMSRETDLGLNFTAVTYYDGQAFLVRKKLGIASALELSQATICAQTGTTTELNVADFFRFRKMPYEIITFGNPQDGIKAYESDRCAVFTSDASHLHSVRLGLARPDEHMVLPEIISKEPLGPVVRKGDAAWAVLVKWVVFAMINAEEFGITSANVDDMKKSPSPEIRRLLGVEGDFGLKLGLDSDWAYRVLKQVGNYGEVFERNVGARSPLKIARGVNALWNKGGIMYAPPIR